MHYYEIALLRSSAPLLTYSSSLKLQEGSIVKVPLKSSVKEGVVLKQVEKPAFKTAEILEETLLFFKPYQLEIANFIKNYYFSSFGEAVSLFYPYRKDIKVKDLKLNINSLPKLTKLQQSALKEIEKENISLLFGVTGSGKTEIYIHLIAQALKRNKDAIVLMPEIALTPQITKRIQNYFGNIVAPWHSKLTKKKREEILEKIASKEIRVIIGARSALFLPLENLGLIVVDEEHDDSYKAMSRPRYNAKDLALYFGKKIGAKVLLGSATPLVSDYKKFKVVRLKKPFKEAKKEYKFSASQEINYEVLNEIKAVLQRGEQALVFVPTRANFKYLICSSCGKNQNCPYCSIGMSIHRKRRALVCHYCNYAQAIPSKCQECGSEELISKRVGTAEVKELIAQEIKEAKIEQFDADTITTGNKLAKALERVKRGESNVIVGTQMLSKGHDYPEITLSVITGLDYIVAAGDYRAKERAIALMHQIAGRSGRNKDAKILIQTSQPQFFTPYLGDYEKFIIEELEFRKDFYPPFKNLARILIADRDYQKAKEKCDEAVWVLKNVKEVEIVGSGLAPIERIANKWRFNVLLRSDRKKNMLKALHIFANDRAVEIDMDPTDFS